MRTLAALAGVAAGCLLERGATPAPAEVWLLTRLGGWLLYNDRKPAKSTLTGGFVASPRCCRPRRS